MGMTYGGVIGIQVPKGKTLADMNLADAGNALSWIRWGPDTLNALIPELLTGAETGGTFSACLEDAEECIRGLIGAGFEAELISKPFTRARLEYLGVTAFRDAMKDKGT